MIDSDSHDSEEQQLGEEEETGGGSTLQQLQDSIDDEISGESGEDE